VTSGEIITNFVDATRIWAMLCAGISPIQGSGLEDQNFEPKQILVAQTFISEEVHGSIFEKVELYVLVSETLRIDFLLLFDSVIGKFGLSINNV
jgi:hypothetical protein